MLFRLTYLLCILAFPVFAQGQTLSDTLDESPAQEMQVILKPTIGLGVGSLKFYGDVSDMHYGNPIIGRFAYELSVANDLTDFLRIRFYVLWGQTSANERSQARNLNFKSRISTGGLILNYNFHHFLKPTRTISPFIGLGIESLEFHSKTDLYDRYGNEYHYWSDGTIRNLPQNSPYAEDAIQIQRDYIFETDLRESNFDGYGKYPERTWAIPAGIGFQMHLSKHLDFVVSSFMHFTFTDLIDNVTSESAGDRINLHPGNKGKDKLLFTSVSLHYNFQLEKPKKAAKSLTSDDFLAIDAGDYDGDGVNDFIDQCHVTPPNVKVNDQGCPLDSDGDGIPDYLDEEPNTPPGMPVLPDGSSFTDEMILADYNRYMDTTGLLTAEVITRKMTDFAYKPKRYQIQIGKFVTGVDMEDISRYLSIPDVKVTTFGDSLTIITVGNYDNLPDALKRKIQLTEQGFQAAEIVSKNEKGIPETIGDDENNRPVDVTEVIAKKNEVFYRVQLGAYANKQPAYSFDGILDLVEAKTEDGLYRYFTKSYTNIDEAETRKTEIRERGFTDAFIEAYKNGKRIAITGAGNELDILNQPSEKDLKNYQLENISYRVQLGIFRNQLPKEKLSEYLKLGSVETIKEGDLTRYVTGRLRTYKEAKTLRNELLLKGFKGTFIISTHNNDLIPLEDAKLLTDD